MRGLKIFKNGHHVQQAGYQPRWFLMVPIPVININSGKLTTGKLFFPVPASA